MNLNDLKASVLGHAIADAMGVPVEFTSRAERLADPVTGYRGYGTHRVPAGTWSDDTSMTLAALDSLAGGLDYADMMECFLDWLDNAAYTATDVVFDAGGTTTQAIRRFKRGTPAMECGSDGEHDNGNGSLMHIIPAAFYCKYAMGDATLDERMEVIHNISALTHAHPRSQLGCGIYAMVLWALLERKDKASVKEALAGAKEYYSRKPEFSPELSVYDRIFGADFAATPESEIRSSGYVVTTLDAALWCLLNTDSYADCILKAINFGRDTDTLGAVAGGLAGVLYGLEGIPQKWQDGLIRHEVIHKLCEKFAFSLREATPVCDIHSHVLFGIDDGSKSPEMSLEMLRIAANQGIRDIFATSHDSGRLESYYEKLAMLQREAAAQNIPVRIHPGCEVCCDEWNLSRAVDRINTGKCPTLGDSEYALLEFYPEERAETITALVEALQRQTGKKVIIAHIERCFGLHNNEAAVDSLRAMGCLFQVNAYDLVEVSDDGIRSFARKLLAERKVDFIGSDAHRSDHRPPVVRCGVGYIYETCDKEYADAVCYGNAERLLLKRI